MSDDERRHLRKAFPVGTIVLWGGRGLYAVAEERYADGRLVDDLVGLEDQPTEINAPGWVALPVPVPRPEDVKKAKRLIRKHLEKVR